MRKAVVQTIVMAALFGLLLFGSAGRLDWPQGWAFIVVFAACSIAVAGALARSDPELLKERTSISGGRGLRPWDRVFFGLLTAIFLIWFVGMGLEARFGPPAWGWPLQALGAALLCACMGIAWRTFQENRYAAPAVQVQADRGQEVIQTGPYAIVRHPLYAGALLWMVGAPLLLGSAWGFLGSAAMAVLVGARAVGEERVLIQGLDGYAAYCRKVRWRFVPGVW